MSELPEDLALADDALIRARSLQKRTDTKFVMPRALLPALWQRVAHGYAVIPTQDQRSASYQTQYFDSPDFACFREHQRGARPRYKVRLRNYVERKLSFVEVKQKTPRDTTEKARMQRQQDSLRLSNDDAIFVSSHCPVHPVSWIPWVNTDFKRITVVGIDHHERLTVDVDLRFWNEDGERRLDTLCVVEVKQAKFSARSPSFWALRELKAKRVSFSKYCAAAALLCSPPRRAQVLARMKGILPDE